MAAGGGGVNKNCGLARALEVNMFARSVLLGRVRLVVTPQVAPAVEDAEVFELEKAGYGVLGNYGFVEVYQVGVVGGVALSGGDAVGIVACRAGDVSV